MRSHEFFNGDFKVKRLARGVLFLALALFFAGPAHAAGAHALTVAVASNALEAMREIASEFERAEGVRVNVVHGSTGKLFTQITQGAPFDVFFSADAERPKLLETKGLAEAGSRFVYTIGVLALWRPDGPFTDAEKDGVYAGKGALLKLSDASFGKIAVANPAVAPYGTAAVEALKSAGAYQEVEKRLVYGENVSQAYGFAATGNAGAAIVPLSTVLGEGGFYLEISSALYSPIVQEAVVLKNTHPKARRFMEFVKGARSRELFLKHGYRTTN
jgi:molybdate transport system substrate-binding protein